MKSGDLDQRVTLEQRVEGQDEAGQPFEDWLPVFDAWAAVEPLGLSNSAPGAELKT